MIDGAEHETHATGDGPVDAAFKAVQSLVPNKARLMLYQVHAVTEGTDAQATVCVRLEEGGKIVTGQSADTDTIVASARAYVNALNKLMVRRLKTAPEAQTRLAASGRPTPFGGRGGRTRTAMRSGESASVEPVRAFPCGRRRRWSRAAGWRTMSRYRRGW